MKDKVPTPWQGLPLNFNPNDWVGFVYLITNLSTTRAYIGKKSLWSNRRVKIKGKKRKKRVRSESDWRYYRSSSKELKALIASLGVKAFNFTILSLHKTKRSMNYTEVKEMFLRDVLYSKLSNGEYKYFNGNILGRHFRGHVHE